MARTTPELRPLSTFGAGGREPYSNALRDPARSLYLRDASSAERVHVGVARFRGAADAGDAALVATARGPVLDVGCGPGRMVHAAILAGHLALGIDISETAAQLGQEQGLPVLRRSVFQDLPGEGDWGTALLLDGNIGIGGDPASLLRRCGELVQTDGLIVVETHVDPSRNRVFEGVVVDDLHQESLPFPWAEIGAISLRRYARQVGLAPQREWVSHGRPFTELARSRSHVR